MKNFNKIMVVGLDSGDPDLITQWADDGTLPTFQRLFRSAVRGRVINPRALEAGSAWPCFYYGMTPARHGQYDGTRYYDRKTYRDSKFTAAMVHPWPIWRVLNAAGKRVALVDAPYRFKAENLNGIDIHDWGPHAPTGKNSFASFSTSPEPLAKEIEAQFGLDPLGGAMCDKFHPRSLEEQRSFRAMMIDRATRKGRISEYINGRESWDFLLTVFSECHCVGHHGWHIHDPEHVDHDPQIARAIGDPVKDVYVAVDKAIGSLIEQADDQTLVVVYSSHGIGRRYSATKLLDKILVRLDGGKVREVSDPVTRMMRNAWRAIPISLRNRLKPAQAKLYKKYYNDGFVGDRENRRFFEVLVNDRTAGIRFNLEGREPQGKVRRADYDAVCKELEDKLLRIVNVETGLPLIKDITRTATEYEGEHRDDLPDLLVTWNRVGTLARIASPEIGEMQHENLSFRTGDHRPEGIFFAYGPGLSGPLDLGRVSVCDFAPTFAAALGATLPETDGKPIAALLPSRVREMESV